ncbi:MAG TPA: ATP-binding protein, partial [Clostridia bacterium]|nr:ATP-binding protein [Clostridia bacterium]
PTDLAALIERSIAANSPLARRQHIALVVQGADALQPVRLDRTLIGQVLNNLLANALEHSPANGRVSIRVAQSDTKVTVTVTDQGQGIRPEEMAGLFQPFGRIRTLKSSGEKSTGLGLTIAKEIVEAHHGQIWVNSAPEQGATFGFALPCETQA